MSSLEGFPKPSGAASATAWGAITGQIGDQIDLASALSSKQATLVSGANIKTVNGSSLLGSGDLAVSGKVIAFHEFDGTTSSWDSATLPTGYSSLEVEIYGRTAKAAANDASKLTFNNDTGATNYVYTRMSKAGSGSPGGQSTAGAANINVTMQGASVANMFAHFILKIPNHEDTHGYKVGSDESSFHDGTNYTTRVGSDWWKNTGAITSIQLASEAGDNFAVGSRIVVRGRIG